MSDEAFGEDDVKRLMRQILEGVSFLHQNNVVHLDLKVSRQPSVQWCLLWKLWKLWKLSEQSLTRLFAAASEHPADQLLSCGRREDR